MQVKIAKQIGAERLSATGARQRQYHLSEPLDGNDYVIVSALPDAFDSGEPETYIFGCDESGHIGTFFELPGSYRGGTSHRKALEGAGYIILK
jgi:hypothetical protein